MRHGCWLVALQKLPGHGAFGNVSIGTISAIDPNYVPRQYQFALKMKFQTNQPRASIPIFEAVKNTGPVDIAGSLFCVWRRERSQEEGYIADLECLTPALLLSKIP